MATLDELNLQVTGVIANDLREIRTKISALPEDTKVDDALSNEISKAVNKLDATLDAELQLRDAYLVTPKRFSLEYLLEEPQELFASGVFKDLPNLCKFDFGEACHCIAFSLPTAAAFHTMRGTEGVLRHYYFSRVKRNRIERLMWGDIVNELRKQKRPPSKPLMDNLDNIRVNFRNPTQHPDARYDLDEAQDLLAISVEVVNRMMKEVTPKQ